MFGHGYFELFKGRPIPLAQVSPLSPHYLPTASEPFHVVDKGPPHSAMLTSPSCLPTLLPLPPPLDLNLSKVFTEVIRELPELFTLHFRTCSAEFSAISSDRRELRGQNKPFPSELIG